MDIFDALSLIGGLCLFLFGMNIMGDALERRAGSALRTLLSRLTTNKMTGFLTGLGVTSVIQSSSATTVMVVGFVNSGLMDLKQAINVIMGANVGTTVTAWLLSLSGIESENFFVQLLKPTSFTPVLALVGIILYMFCNGSKKKDTGAILLGFATLMFGMDTMSSAVSGLSEVEEFRNLFLMFQNPILGVLAGALLTAIIQSSSASVGILQALAITGQVSYGAAIPIIMGQNIGTCITAMLSSIGTNKNAKRAAVVHLSFNVIGTMVWLSVFCVVKYIFSPALLDQSASLVGIAVAHSAFNILCTALLLPMSGVLEAVAKKIIPDAKTSEKDVELDERLLDTPPLALESCRRVTAEMGELSVSAMKESIKILTLYTDKLAEDIREKEEKTDRYEDMLGTYLVKLSSNRVSDADSAEVTELLKMIGDFERISDHAVNVLESAEELRQKGLSFSEAAMDELRSLTGAVGEILDLSMDAFVRSDLEAAAKVEPLEQVVDDLKESMRTRHMIRLQRGECSIDAGFVWSDLLTDLERVADHCSNIAGCVLDAARNNVGLHEALREFRVDNQEFMDQYDRFAGRYALSDMNDQITI
ncbi:MAG TPA: Na/Pi cotransporter family protein [Candidatus Fimisoma avicola]|uniref:Na/Pi cotransporter family protein n=1 Tax=Candidatus Fimisoma avicola TaxID=2840826 RepID=A0A9D1L8T3_9FIRM|nr:Na/Pi cotransporter family protein [Candidatus Fimisoma avicola]